MSDDIVQSDGPPAPPPPEAVDWFLIIAGKQVGPMSEAEVEERLKRREIDRRSYAWREGMPEWLRLESIENFQALASEVGDASWRIVTPIEATYPESGAPEKPNDEAPAAQEKETEYINEYDKD